MVLCPGLVPTTNAEGLLRPRSLTFRSPEMEAGFLRRRADRLLSSIVAVSLVYVFSLGILLATAAVEVYLMGLQYGVIEVLETVSIAISFVLALAMLVFAKSPRLYERVGLVQREYLVVAFHVLSVSQAILCNGWYLAQLVGVEALSIEQCYDRRVSEAALLLTLSILLMVVHFTMPLRWVAVLVMEVAVVALYTIVALALRSCEKNAWFLAVCLTVMVVLASLGNRQLERAERQLVLHLIGEKHLRAKAEFSLAQTQEEQKEPEDVASALSTHSSAPVSSVVGRIVQSLSVAVQPRLEPLAEIGRSEQWLLDAAELTIDSGASLLGMGGQGIVACGRWLRTPVAVKFIKKPTSSNQLRDIANELRVLRKLRHPSIILLHGACMDFRNGDIALVLERACGVTLDDYVNCENADMGVRSVMEVFQLLVGTCHALQYLHSRHPPVVHGDLKGANIVVERHSSGPHAKLLDFGLSRVLTRQAKPLGATLRWAAPEVFAEAKPAPAADVFSFGRIIYFLCVWKRPLYNYDQLAMRLAAKRRTMLPLAWPQELSAESRWCRPIVEAASAAAPEDRPPIEAVCRKLEAAADSILETETAHLDRKPSRPDWLPPCTRDASYEQFRSNESTDFWQSIRELRQIGTAHARRPRQPRAVPEHGMACVSTPSSKHKVSI